MIDSGRGYIERTGFDGPVLQPKRGRGRYGDPIKAPGSRAGRRTRSVQKLTSRPYLADSGRGTAHRFFTSYVQRLTSRLRGKPGFPTHSKLGVPDGYRKAEAMKLWQEARRKAVNTFIELVNQGRI